MCSVGREMTGGTFFYHKNILCLNGLLSYHTFGHICFVLPPLQENTPLKNSAMATKKKQRNVEKNFARNKKCDKI